MSLKFVPSVGLRGSFEAADPFRGILIDQAIYEIISVETIPSLILRGEDPYADHYEPYGIGEDRYESDRLDNTLILTLQCDQGDMVHVPSSFILGLPAIDGVVYDLTMLGVALGALPDYLDLEELKTKISDLILDQAGVDCTIVESTYGPPQLMRPDQHRGMESYRKSRVRNAEGSLQRIRELEAALESSKAKVDLLESYLISIGIQKSDTEENPT